MKKDLLYGFIGAIVLYIPYALVGYLAYMSLTMDGLTVLSGFSFILGALICSCTLLYRNDSFAHALFRSAILVLLPVLISALLATIGVSQYLDHAFEFVINEANGRASGLGMVLFLYCMFWVCILSSIVAWIKKRIKEKV